MNETSASQPMPAPLLTTGRQGGLGGSMHPKYLLLGLIEMRLVRGELL